MIPKRILFIITVSLSLNSCSYIAMYEAPPRQSWDSGEYYNCSPQISLPSYDVLVALGALLPAAFLFSSSGKGQELGLFYLIYGVPFGASAVYGFNVGSTCRDFIKYKKSKSKLLKNSNFSDPE